MKIGVIVQARMGSTRLPGKVLKDIQGKTVLQHVIERIGHSKFTDEIIVATTTCEDDLVIADEAIRCGAKVFRGSEDDVLSRYYYSAKENDIDIIIRVTSDCPLIDSKLLDDMIEYYIQNKYDVVTNAGSDVTNRTYPRGLDVEIFSFNVLESAFYNAKEDYQREHVTPYIYENSFEVFYYKQNIDYSSFRWTLDTIEDFQLISKVYSFLYHGVHDFYMEDIMRLFRNRPELYNINVNVKQKELKK